MKEEELQRLAAAARDGEDAAFERLVRSLTRTLVALAFRYTADWDAARDITQETWVRVHGALARWNPERSFTAWLHAIHRNACRDHLRDPWVGRRGPLGDAALENRPRPGEPDPLARVEAREFRERILHATASLSPSQREVFLRVDVEDGDQRTVARELGIRYGTLRVTLHTARKRLAEILRPMEGTA